jgi:hypothetical protein
MKVIGTRGRLTSEELGQQTQDISKRSITPDTHKARVMSGNLQDLNPQLLIASREEILSRFSQDIIENPNGEEVKREELQLENYSYYVDTYSYDIHPTSRVLHFGINTYREGLREELHMHNTVLKEKLNEGNEKCSNISGASNYQKFSTYIELTDSEKSVLDNAINYMLTSSQNTSLVDIFPRELNAKKIGITGGINISELDTHTVLLYKTINDKILVIDPNNPMFSTHLNKHSERIETLCSVNNKHKIYTPPSNESEIAQELQKQGFNKVTGYSPEQWRDCIDVAVKLAFLLNEDTLQYQSVVDIMSSEQVKLVTNNSDIDCLDFKKSDLIRIKQISDVSKISECNQKMLLMSQLRTKQKEDAFSIFNEEQQRIKIQYDNILEEINEKYSSELVELSGDYESTFVMEN